MIKWYLAAPIFLTMALGFSGISCSGDVEEKGRIEKMTEKVGKDAANKLTAPIGKAKDAKEQQEERDRDMVEKAPDK